MEFCGIPEAGSGSGLELEVQTLERQALERQALERQVQNRKRSRRAK